MDSGKWGWSFCGSFRWFALVAVAMLVVRNNVLAQDEQNLENVPYPTFHTIPRGLTFQCNDKIPGYYADPETQCQVWHWCVPSGQKFSFLCPNGTVFDQRVRVCNWFYNVDCQEATSYYNVNNDLYKDSEGNLIKG